MIFGPYVESHNVLHRLKRKVSSELFPEENTYFDVTGLRPKRCTDMLGQRYSNQIKQNYMVQELWMILDGGKSMWSDGVGQQDMG